MGPAMKTWLRGALIASTLSGAAQASGPLSRPSGHGHRPPDASTFERSGLETTLTFGRGADLLRTGSQTVGAFGVATSRVGFGFERGAIVRVVNVGSLAVGRTGIQGGFTSAVSGGYRLSLAETHGPFVRGGIEGGIFGNQALWDSSLELPQLHLGWQWLARTRESPRVGQLIDVAWKGGYVLVGRHNTGNVAWRTTSGSFEAGAIASVHLGPVALRGSYTRILAEGGPIDQIDMSLCGVTARLFVCQSVRYEVGDVRVRPSGELLPSRVSVLGLSVGLVSPKRRLD